MNILYHHRTQGKTVEGVHIREVVNALRHAGHHVTIVSPPGVNPYITEQKEKPCRRSLIAHLLGLFSGCVPQFVFELMEIFYNFYAYVVLSRAFQRQKFDFIYERYAFFGIAGSLIARRYQIPIIEEVNEISGIKRQRSQFFIKLTGIFERYLFKKVDGIVVVSSYLKNRIEDMGILSEKILVLPNAVNPLDFDSTISPNAVKTKYDLAGNTTVLGFLGSFSRWDDLESLLEVFNELHAKYNDVRLMLVGDGFNRSTLEGIVAAMGLARSVVFTGRVPRHNIQKYIAAMDICVIPASNPFGSPVAMFEFMAMGKPVVGPGLLPICDVLEDNNNGLIFQPGSKSGLTLALSRLVENPDLRRSLGSNARASILAKHTWNRSIEHILTFFMSRTHHA